MTKQHIVIVLFFITIGFLVNYTFLSKDLKTDISFFLPDKTSNPLLVHHLQSGQASNMLLITLQGSEISALEKTSTKLTNALRENSNFSFATNGSNYASPAEQKFLKNNRYAIPPMLNIDSFTPENLAETIEIGIGNLSRNTANSYKNILPWNPDQRLENTLGFLAPLNGRKRNVSLWSNTDQTKVYLLVLINSQSYNLETLQLAINKIKPMFETLSENKDIQIEMIGAPIYALEVKERIQNELLLLTSLSLVLVFGVLFFAFRSLKTIWLISLPISCGVLSGAAMVTWAYGDLHGIVLTFGITLIGVSVDYPIHWIGLRQRDDIKGSSLWRNLQIGCLTTVIAFVPILMTDFPSLAQLGLFSISGLLTALLVTRYILPRLQGDIPPQLNMIPLPSLTHHCHRLKKIIVIAALVSFSVLLIQMPSVNWTDDLASFSPIEKDKRQKDRDLRIEMGAPDLRYFLYISAESEEVLLRRGEELVSALDTLIVDGKLLSYDFIGKYLQSESRQQHLKDTLPTGTEFSENIGMATQNLGIDPNFFKPFLNDIEIFRTTEPINIQALKHMPVGWRQSDLLTRINGVYFAKISLVGLSSPDQLSILSNEYVHFLDVKTGTEKILQGYRIQATNWLLISIFLSGLILLATIGFNQRTAKIFASVLFATLLTLIPMIHLSSGLTLFHLLSLLIIAGLGTDYCVFLSTTKLRPKACLTSTIYCYLTTMSVFAILAMSSVPMLKIIGSNVALGGTICFGTAFLVFYSENKNKTMVAL